MSITGACVVRGDDEWIYQVFARDVLRVRGMSAQKRLFFGVEVIAPWPSKLPEGRQVPEASRHMTVAFLGNTDFSKLESLLPKFPRPTYHVSPAGSFDRCVFLPPRSPRVVSWHVHLEQEAPLLTYQQTISAWLTQHGYVLERRDFLPHVTVARHPFTPSHWKKSFVPLPMIVRHLCLYESVGQLTYKIRWQRKFLPPFEQIKHASGRAFRIWGENLGQLQRHAQVAQAFQEAECPVKGVSFCGDAQEIRPGVWQREMICDG